MAKYITETLKIPYLDWENYTAEINKSLNQYSDKGYTPISVTPIGEPFVDFEDHLKYIRVMVVFKCPEMKRKHQTKVVEPFFMTTGEVFNVTDMITKSFGQNYEAHLCIDRVFYGESNVIGAACLFHTGSDFKCKCPLVDANGQRIDVLELTFNSESGEMKIDSKWNVITRVTIAGYVCIE